MNRLRTHGLAPLITAAILASVLLAADAVPRRGADHPFLPRSSPNTVRAPPSPPHGPIVSWPDALRCWERIRSQLRTTGRSVPSSRAHDGPIFTPPACPMSIWL